MSESKQRVCVTDLGVCVCLPFRAVCSKGGTATTSPTNRREANSGNTDRNCSMSSPVNCYRKDMIEIASQWLR